MNEKDIYATIARIKLTAIMAEEDNSDHGDCACTICTANRVKDHPEDCRCNACITVREELGLWGSLTHACSGHVGTRPDNADPGIQISGQTVEGWHLPPCR